jgi:hypothetical protein
MKHSSAGGLRRFHLHFHVLLFVASTRVLDLITAAKDTAVVALQLLVLEVVVRVCGASFLVGAEQTLTPHVG